MNNFLKFIEEDIEAKKTLISTMPTNTKVNKRKLNNKLIEISQKYNNYQENLKKYIDVQTKKFNIESKPKNLQKLTDEVTNLEHVRFILNPMNTYFEKMGFDTLMYQISNYSDFNFESLNKIINDFLDKFEMVGINLASNDFDYTCYVNEYMTVFLETRSKKSNNFDKVSKIFEEIYWVNPEIIGHIELNFRKLIWKNSKKFINYIKTLTKEAISKNEIKDYNDCLEKLRDAYNRLKDSEEESITDIIALAKNGSIDINHYLNDSKVRSDAYSSFAIDSLNFDNVVEMDKFYSNLIKLKSNVEEYSNYIQFIPLVNEFKSTYEKELANKDKDSDKSIKSITASIKATEGKLNKINKKIFNNKLEFLMVKNLDQLKQLKMDSVNLAKELYSLYSEYNNEFFKQKVLSELDDTFTIAEFLNLYYSFDYFKKLAIKKVFNLNNYDDLIDLSNNFDLFAMDLNNVIMEGVTVFADDDVTKVIENKYKLNNINLTSEDLSGDLSTLIDRINLLLRIQKIENSPITIEKIWFLVQVEKINSRKDYN